MKNTFVLFTLLLAFALFSTACGAQDATNQPGEVTTAPTGSTEEITTTEEAGEADLTPTGGVEEATEAPTEGTAASDGTPTVTVENGTPATEGSGTAGVPQTGLGEAGVPDDLQEAVRVLIEAGATVEVGEEVQQDAVNATGRIVRIDGEEVRFFNFASAENLEIQASQVAANADPESEPQYYKLGTMLVFYAGRDPGVRDLLEDVLGAKAAGPGS